MRKYLTLLLLFILMVPVTAVYAGKTAKPVVKKPAVLVADTNSKVTVHNFSDKQLKSYLQDKDFRYNKADVEGESLWDSFWGWFWSWVRRRLFSSDNSRSFIYYLMVTCGALFLVYVILKMVGINATTILRGSARSVALPYAETLENIHEIDFDLEIEKAVSQHNYRRAVRLQYLRCLKQLSDAQLIHWQIEKTNAAYLGELTNDEQRQVFGLLTRQFEYVWYGDFSIDGQSYQNINVLFQDFKRMLK